MYVNEKVIEAGLLRDKNIHSENRQEIVNFLRADMLGLSNLTKL